MANGRADDLADRLPRVQRGVGILEDHLHLASQRSQGAALQLRDVLSVEADRFRPWRRAGGARGERWSTFRSRTRRRARASRPCWTVKLTSSTAWTWPTVRCRSPEWIGKRFVRCSTSTSGPRSVLVGAGGDLRRRGLTRHTATAMRASRRSVHRRRLSVDGQMAGLGWPPPRSRNSGRSWSQGAKRCGHRGWNGQPGGTLISDGGEPSIGTGARPSRRRAGSTRGGPTCTGAAAGRRSPPSRRAPSSDPRT